MNVIFTNNDFVVIYSIMINIMTFILFKYDKYCAQHKKWRIPEITLLLFSLCGGAAGAMLAMYAFKHKTKHATFQVCIPLFLLAQMTILLIINN